MYSRHPHIRGCRPTVRRSGLSDSTLEYSNDQASERASRRRFLGRGFWTLFDQGVVSAGNFFTMVIPGRGETRGEYGAFSILFGLMLVLNNIHMSLASYQVSVRGGASDDKHVLRRLVAN